MKRKRILFVAEAITLSQVVRLFVLAQGLDPDQYEVHFASAEFDDLIFKNANFKRWNIQSIPKSKLFKSIEKGTRLYEYSTLKGYVKEELELFKQVQPDLVVGDLRLSL